MWLPFPSLLPPFILRQVQELHQNGQRLKLNIVIDAPEVIIPVSSVSPEVIVAYLGHLTLSNTFHLVESSGTNGRAAGGGEAIFEKYKIELSDLEVYR